MKQWFCLKLEISSYIMNSSAHLIIMNYLIVQLEPKENHSFFVLIAIQIPRFLVSIFLAKYFDCHVHVLATFKYKLVIRPCINERPATIPSKGFIVVQVVRRLSLVSLNQLGIPAINCGSKKLTGITGIWVLLEDGFLSWI